MYRSHPKRAIFLSFLLILPFVILNAVIATRFEPLYSMLGFLASTPWLPSFLILLFPLSLFIAIRPMLHKDENGHHRFYVLNIIWSVLILVATVLLWGGLGEDIIACDILHVPNCD